MGNCESPKQKTSSEIPPYQNKCNKNIRINELYPFNGFKRIPLKMSKHVCKITHQKGSGTGFFLYNNSNKNKYLLTNNHVIDKDMVNSNSNVDIEIYDGKNIPLNLKDIQDYIKFYEPPIDITIIKINDIKEISNCAPSLEIDSNNKKDYNIYQYEKVFTFGYPFGIDVEFSQGIIVSISGEEFEHNCDTDQGCSGSPIILESNFKVVGIHKQGIIDKKTNSGTFLGIIDEFNEINKINTNYDKKAFVAIDKMKIRMNQMEKSICRIEKKNKYSTGFLCHIKNYGKTIPVLITCNHCIDKTDIGKEIKLIFYDKEKPIKLDESRKIYSNKEYNITLIEMKENEFDNDDYLTIDEQIYEENEINYKKILTNKPVYIISFPKGDQDIKEGDIITIEKNNIFHNCKTTVGSGGAPIINLDNCKVLGIHSMRNKETNEGIGYIIPNFMNKNIF